MYSIEQEVKKFNLFSDSDVNEFSNKYFDDSIPLEEIQGILEYVVVKWRDLEEDDKEEFRSGIQSYIRLYGYITQIISFRDINLEKIFYFLNFLNKKLPRRKKDRLSDIVSSVDLEYFRIEKKYQEDISLESDPYVEPISVDVSTGVNDEPKDFFSNIIKIINENYGGDLTEDDKLNLRRIHQELKQDEELQKIHEGDNTDTNKRFVFDKVFEKYLLTLVDRDMKFYNKLKEKKLNKYVKDRMYESYSRGL